MNVKTSGLVLGWAVYVLAGRAGAIAPASNDGAAVDATGGMALITLPSGTLVRQTTDKISGMRVVQVPGSVTSVVLWSEQDRTGLSTPYYAISLDGKTVARMTPTTYELKVRYLPFNPLISEPDVPAALAASDVERLFIVQFLTQPLQEYRDAIEAPGGTIHHFLNAHAYIVEMNPELAAAIRALPFVRWVGSYHPAYRLEPGLPELLTAPSAGHEPRVYNVQVVERGPAQKEIVADRIRALGGSAEVLEPDGFLLEATLTPAQLQAVIHMDEVFYVDRWSEPVAFMEKVRVDGGADYVELVAGYTGEGVRGEVMDTELNVGHPAFQARRPLIHRAGSSQPHGTSVYGICFGDGTGNANGRGLIPDAQGIFGFWQPPDRLGHTAELLRDPYFAVFQTNSWGQCCRTDYGTEAMQMDDIAFQLDFLLLQAQANNGSRSSSGHAWGKNIVSVGGIQHLDTQTRGDDRWNRTGSIGPAEDGRIKPDLAYWYDSILTTSSNGGYTPSFGGTSAATPETAGHFGIMFQIWSDGIFGNPVDPNGTVFENRPHLATAKALMVNTAAPYEFQGQGHDLTRVHQGFGLASVRNLFDLRNKIFVVDETDVLRNLESTTHLVEVEPDTPVMKATLVYTDLPGTTSSNQHRINDVSLKVTSPGGVDYFGNRGLLDSNSSTPGGIPNSIDTVENVWVTNPEPGAWSIEVSADEINRDAHVETPEVDADYALVVSGVIGAEPTEAACCFDNGDCSDLLPDDCRDQGGRWYLNRECSSFQCPIAGACCIDNNTCEQLLERECVRIPDAVFLGEGVSCRRACTCDQIRQFKGSCSGGGTVKGLVKFRDDRFDGETVEFLLNGNRRFEVVVRGKKATLFTCCFDGPQTLSLIDPAGCRDPIQVNCP